MSQEGKFVMELTRNPVDESWGFICLEHGIHRAGLTERHAVNVEAKHRREDHPDPLTLTLDLSAAAETLKTLQESDAQRYHGAVALWQALTGMERLPSLRFADQCKDSAEPVRAAVVPF